MNYRNFLNKCNLERLVFLLVLLSYSIILLAILASSVEDNNIPLKNVSKYKISKLVPEGWGFFTRDPQEEDYYVYRYDSNLKTISLLTRTLNSPHNKFGLNRICDNSGIELGLINSKIKKSEWTICRTRLDHFDIKDLKVIRIVNNFPFPSMAGLYILQKKRPVPFAWAKSFKSEMPSNIVLINIVTIRKNDKKD